MTERLHFHFSLSCIGEGNGNPLECSCLENPRDRGAWWASIYGVAQSQTRLKPLSSSNVLFNKLTASYQQPRDCPWPSCDLPKFGPIKAKSQHSSFTLCYKYILTCYIMTCLLFMSKHSYRFNFPLIYHQELIASKYNLAALNQSLSPGAETQPWVVLVWGAEIYFFFFVLFSYCCWVFWGWEGCFVCFPSKVRDFESHFLFYIREGSLLM